MSAAPPSASGLTELVAGFIAGQTADTVPAAVVERVKHSILDSIGCAVYGRPNEPVQPYLEYVRASGGNPVATVFGAGFKTSAQDAALMNSTLIHTTELAEGFTRALVHPSTVVVPAVLAVAERDGRSGMDVLVATAVGYELLIRMGMTVGASLVLEQGLHPPATLGGFAATASLSSLGGFDDARTRNALGIVACNVPTALMAAGFDHATVKDMFQGQAAAVGVTAADLASRGVTGVHDWIGSWYRSVPRTFDLAPIPDRLGEYWHTSSGGIRIKTRPVMAMAQPTMGSLHDLLSERDVPADEITDILVQSSNRIELGRIYHPAEIVSARASIPFLVAAVLRNRDRFVADPYFLRFLDEKMLTDERIGALQDLVRLETDPEFDYNLEKATPNADGPYMKFEARVTITLASGETIVAYKDMFAAGTGNMTREQVAHKFTAVTEDSLGPDRAAQVVEAVWNLDAAKDTTHLVELLTEW